MFAIFLLEFGDVVENTLPVSFAQARLGDARLDVLEVWSVVVDIFRLAHRGADPVVAGGFGGDSRALVVAASLE